MNERPEFKITRTGKDRFAVTSNIMMSDGTFRGDGFCRLDGSVLRSVEGGPERIYRIDGLFKLRLGPVSFALVGALAEGASVTVG